MAGRLARMKESVDRRRHVGMTAERWDGSPRAWSVDSHTSGSRGGIAHEHARGPDLAFVVSMSISTKSLPIPVASARKNFSDVVAQARAGQRIKLTRHGKNVAWIIGQGDRENLAATKSKRKKRGRGKP